MPDLSRCKNECDTSEIQTLASMPCFVCPEPEPAPAEEPEPEE